jgi:hypothetical protein
VVREQRVHGLVDLRQAPLLRRIRRGRDHAAVERDQAPVAARDDAVARAREPGVDPEDDHEG